MTDSEKLDIAVEALRKLDAWANEEDSFKYPRNELENAYLLVRQTLARFDMSSPSEDMGIRDQAGLDYWKARLDEKLARIEQTSGADRVQPRALSSRPEDGADDPGTTPYAAGQDAEDMHAADDWLAEMGWGNGGDAVQSLTSLIGRVRRVTEGRIRADEREACAKVCDQVAVATSISYGHAAAKQCGKSIRARGEK